VRQVTAAVQKAKLSALKGPIHELVTLPALHVPVANGAAQALVSALILVLVASVALVD